MGRIMLHIGANPTLAKTLLSSPIVKRNEGHSLLTITTILKIKSGFKLSVTAIEKQSFQFLEFTDHIYIIKKYAL
jgi:hypothetical protein